MSKILITHPIHPHTVNQLNLKLIEPNLRRKKAFLAIAEDIYFASSSYAHEEILYIPSIATKQIPDEKHDHTLEILCQTLVVYQPDVLIVGNNAVPGKVIEAWRAAVGEQRNLLTIRRGVDTRAIDKIAADKYRVKVENLPGINSPYVARHMLKHLNLEQAKPGSKVAVIGVGNIGKHVAIAAIKQNLAVELFSPSLQDSHKRLLTLEHRGIPAERVVCAQSIAQALRGATYVSIAIPWEKEQGVYNIDIIDAEQIDSLANHARIVSASVPRIFSSAALALMNKCVQQKQMYVRIDTAKRRAQEAKQSYPYLDTAYDQAFAASECQQALDQAMLEQARSFITRCLSQVA